jgi:hypothetical protein
MHLKRAFTTKRILVFVSVYFAVWFLTYAVGGAQARRDALNIPIIDSSFSEIPSDVEVYCCKPVYSCRVVSYVPFFVTVRYNVYKGDFAFGGTSVYLWAGLLSRPYHVSDWVT